MYTWTDRMIAPSMISGNPHQLKMFVGNHISEMNGWQHVVGEHNPVDSTSWRLLPSELLRDKLWWKRPPWLRKAESEWPVVPDLFESPEPSEKEEVSLLASLDSPPMLLIVENFSRFTCLKRVTAWVIYYISNCWSLSGPHKDPCPLMRCWRQISIGSLWLKAPPFRKRFSCWGKDASFLRKAITSYSHHTWPPQSLWERKSIKSTVCWITDYPQQSCHYEADCVRTEHLCLL